MLGVALLSTHRPPRGPPGIGTVGVGCKPPFPGCPYVTPRLASLLDYCYTLFILEYIFLLRLLKGCFTYFRVSNGGAVSCACHKWRMQAVLHVLSWTMQMTSLAIRTFSSHWGNSAMWRRWAIMSESAAWASTARMTAHTCPGACGDAHRAFCALLFPADCHLVSFTLNPGFLYSGACSFAARCVSSERLVCVHCVLCNMQEDTYGCVGAHVDVCAQSTWRAISVAWERQVPVHGSRWIEDILKIRSVKGLMA